MNKIKKVLMILIAFMHLASFVYAQAAARELAFDYALFSGEFHSLKEGEEKIEFKFYNGSYSICEHEAKAIPILVVNRDANDNKYFLDATGASWISLNAKEFLLPKRQSGVVFLYLSPGQNTNGRYEIKLNALSSIGNIKRDLSLDVNVEKCYAISLELEKEEDKVCGGIEKQYSGEIANGGNRQSDIELNVKGTNWISIDRNVFSIGANEKRKFELNADVPANAEGIFSVFVSAALQNLPSIKSEKELMIEAVPKYDCYKPDILTNEKIMNYYSNAYAPIKIRNSGVKQAIYEISLEAPDWVSLEPKKLAVNPEQLGNLNLNINPNAEISEGAYAVKIILKFEDIVYSKNVDVILTRENQFLKGLKFFFVFYQYYIYVVLFIVIILLIFRRKISSAIKAKYKNYKIRRARLRALKKAREAR